MAMTNALIKCIFMFVGKFLKRYNSVSATCPLLRISETCASVAVFPSLSPRTFLLSEYSMCVLSTLAYSFFFTAMINILNFLSVFIFHFVRNNFFSFPEQFRLPLFALTFLRK